MADLVASPVVNLVLEKLVSGLWRELGLIKDVKKNLEKLQELLSTISDVLEDAERRSISDKSLHNWLRSLRSAALDADDVVDEFQWEALRQRAEGRNRIGGKVRDFFSSHNSLVFSSKMAHKIKDLRNKFDEIAKLRKDFHLTGGSSWERVNNRETYSFVIDSEVYGRDEDRYKVIDFLVNLDNDKDVSILPIIGLGGVGKTTLAQLVYGDARVVEQFELQMWTCVGEEFSVASIAKAIVERATEQACPLSDIESVQQLLRETLRGKRFLLVLDDVWNENAGEWERLKSLLRGVMQGSKIIVTTRSEEVARIMGTAATPHRLKVLSDDCCWKLFEERAFGSGKERYSERLVEIGKEIVKKCGGLPLAAKALGTLMASKVTEKEWLDVRDSEIWRPSVSESEILPALRLSYDHLPSHLKRCFSYCALFPKDYQIEKETLISWWIAEGFIESSEGDMDAEDIGSQYFNTLLWRSFFQDTERDAYGSIVSCKMHDLIHDLACSVAWDECSNLYVSRAIVEGLEARRMGRVASTHRYLSLVCDAGPPSGFPDSAYEAKKLRLLFTCRGNTYFRGPVVDASKVEWKNFLNLRVLHLPHQTIEEIPKAIGKLKHLRLLDLSWSRALQKLPSSITGLYNLQELNLCFCTKLQMLPQGIGNLSNLRRLDNTGCDGLICMPRGLGRLSRLRRLPLFVVGEGRGSGSGCSIAELKNLNQLGGVLEIRGLQNVKDAAQASEANLRAKTRLQGLVLGGCEDKDVLEKLQPPSDIKRLELRDYSGMGFPCWIWQIDQLSNLTEIELYDVERCECLPAFGQLPSLEELAIGGMSGVKRIGKEFLYSGNCDDTKSSAAGGGTNNNNNDNNSNVVFPSLKRLDLWAMPNLEEWSTVSETGSLIFPCLEYLRISSCPRLRIQPYLPSSIVELEIWDSNEELLSSTETGAGAGGGGCLKGLPSLKKLTISCCKASSSPCAWDGLQYLTALEKLQIRYCDDLTEGLPDGMVQQNMPSLRTLTLFSDGNLKSLIREAQQQQQPPPFFTHLHRLRIEGCHRLTALPEWVGGLTSLQSLEISGCENIAMLPDGLQHLTRLQKLEIRSCPALDWHKIAHIPNIILPHY